MTEQLRRFRDRYAGFVPGDYEEYCDLMSKPMTWGDNITLQAAADFYGCEIFILTSYQQEAIIRVLPEGRPSEQKIWLAFWAEVHYNSLHLS